MSRFFFLAIHSTLFAVAMVREWSIYRLNKRSGQILKFVPMTF